MTGKCLSMNQSCTFYYYFVPAMEGYTKEADVMPYFENLVQFFVDIEKRGFCVVDGQEVSTLYSLMRCGS